MSRGQGPLSQARPDARNAPQRRPTARTLLSVGESCVGFGPCKIGFSIILAVQRILTSIGLIKLEFPGRPAAPVLSVPPAGVINHSVNEGGRRGGIVFRTVQFTEDVPVMSAPGRPSWRERRCTCLRRMKRVGRPGRGVRSRWGSGRRRAGGRRRPSSSGGCLRGRGGNGRG